MKITAIIPTYNRADLVGETVRAVLGQTRPPDEVIVIDDGSSDGTPGLFADWAGVRYLRQDNQGKSAALNHALAHATGDAIWIVDDDDIPLPDALAALAAPLDADPAIDLSFGWHDALVLRDGAWVRQPLPQQRFDPAAVRFISLLRCYTHQPAMLVRSRHLRAVGPFDTRLVRSQDYDMLVRLSRHGRAAALDRVLFLQRKHDGARGSSADRISAADRAAKWVQYDAIVLGKVFADYALEEFTPDPGERDRAVLLAARAMVAARRGLWREAGADLTRMGAEAGDRALPPGASRALAMIFDGGGGYALLSLAGSAPFFAALAQLPPRLRMAIARASIRPLLRQAKGAVAARSAERMRLVSSAAARFAAAACGRATSAGG